MVLYLGADHGGFQLKEAIKSNLTQKGYEVVDCGNTALDPTDDYPDFARPVAEHVSRDPEQARGILVCRSGVGMGIAANKFKHVRAFVPMSNDQVYSARHDDDVNVMAIGADTSDHSAVEGWINVFLETPLDTEARRQRRIDKISAFEQ